NLRKKRAQQASCNIESKRPMNNKSSEDEADWNASSLIDSLKFTSSIESRGRRDRAGAGGRSEKGDDAEETGPGGGKGRSENGDGTWGDRKGSRAEVGREQGREGRREMGGDRKRETTPRRRDRAEARGDRKMETAPGEIGRGAGRR
ncbi:hypothetical protein ACLOJK_041225, partial [Asimina triloba]